MSEDTGGPTELFKTIRLDGDRVPDAALTLTLGVSQTYEVPLRIGCYYEPKHDLTTADKRFSIDERGTRVGETLIDAGLPRTDDTDRAGVVELEYHFFAPEPGTYKLTCLTPAATNNQRILYFTIAG